MITVVFDEGGYAVSVFKDDVLYWNGKAEYLDDVLYELLRARVIHVDTLFKRDDWDWKDRYESLQELLDSNKQG